MFTVCPSPLFPLTMAVTTTSVSFPTKFRMQRSRTSFALRASSSNRRPWAKVASRSKLQRRRSRDDRCVIVGRLCLWDEQTRKKENQSAGWVVVTLGEDGRIGNVSR